MPLSEHEQRILEEIERRLVADDPKFAREVAAGGGRGAALKRVKRAATVFVLGFGVLVLGLFVPERLIVLGIVAFAVMVASAAVVAAGIKEATRERAPDAGPRQGWFGRMEDRWRKRYERGEET